VKQATIEGPGQPEGLAVEQMCRDEGRPVHGPCQP
jgi:hypothetical protein